MKKITMNSESNRNMTTEVPWHNTFNKDKSVVGSQHELRKVIVCNSGLLLLTESFKTFLFDNSNLRDFMSKAMMAYVRDKSLSQRIILEVTSKKNPDIYVDDEYDGKQYWAEDEKGYYYHCDDYGTSNTPDKNPFLPSTSADDVDNTVSKTRTRKSK